MAYKTMLDIPLVVLSLDEGDEMLLDVLEIGRYSRLTRLSSRFMSSLEEVCFVK